MSTDHPTTPPTPPPPPVPPLPSVPPTTGHDGLRDPAGPAEHVPPVAPVAPAAAAAGGPGPGQPVAADRVRVDAARPDAVHTDGVRPEAVRADAGDARPGLQDQAEEPPQTADEPIRTLLWTAATYRPLEEVAALVSLLKGTTEVPNPGDEALRAAAVARPLEEVRQLVTMLGEPPHNLDEADTTLRAAAVGRPIEDVAQLVNILGTDDGEGWPLHGKAARDTTRRQDTTDGAATAADETKSGNGTGRFLPGLTPAALTPPAAPRDAASRGARTVSPVLRSVLRWPTAIVLLVCGLVHLPMNLAGLRSGGYADILAVAVTALCLSLCVWVAMRDTARVWAAGAATAVGVVALHAMAGVGGLNVLDRSLGGSYAWASTAAVMCGALAALLAGSALLRRPRPADATTGGG
ncbi:hypothetical protein [Streptomyces sp. NPDC006368]|uniref:hypothetical protein n=1 Tax=Streptomyces sp. NPDC006368 TaxID=3156760 RepID=UPI0033AC46C8